MCIHRSFPEGCTRDLRSLGAPYPPGPIPNNRPGRLPPTRETRWNRQYVPRGPSDVCPRSLALLRLPTRRRPPTARLLAARHVPGPHPRPPRHSSRRPDPSSTPLSVPSPRLTDVRVSGIGPGARCAGRGVRLFRRWADFVEFAVDLLRLLLRVARLRRAAFDVALDLLR